MSINKKGSFNANKLAKRLKKLLRFLSANKELNKKVKVDLDRLKLFDGCKL
jgi:hypothetical protein